MSAHSQNIAGVASLVTGIGGTITSKVALAVSLTPTISISEQLVQQQIIATEVSTIAGIIGAFASVCAAAFYITRIRGNKND